MDDWLPKELRGLPFSFSKNCRSGLLKRCECWRCRQQRNEPVTTESEELAEQQAKVADEDFRARTQEFLKRHGRA